MDSTTQLLSASLARLGLDAEACERLVVDAERVDARAGALLVREGQPEGAALLVVSGAVESFLRGEPVGRAGPGELVRARLTTTGEPITVRALVRTTCLRLPMGLPDTLETEAQPCSG